MKSKHKKIKKWENKTFDTIIDVRSPLEYEEDHIIGSINCPVLNDQERIIVGTIYKKESTFIQEKKIFLLKKKVCRVIKKKKKKKKVLWR